MTNIYTNMIYYDDVKVYASPYGHGSGFSHPVLVGVLVGVLSATGLQAVMQPDKTDVAAPSQGLGSQ